MVCRDLRDPGYMRSDDKIRPHTGNTQGFRATGKDHGRIRKIRQDRPIVWGIFSSVDRVCTAIKAFADIALQ